MTVRINRTRFAAALPLIIARHAPAFARAGVRLQMCAPLGTARRATRTPYLLISAVANMPPTATEAVPVAHGLPVTVGNVTHQIPAQAVADGDAAAAELRPHGIVQGRRIPDIMPAAAVSATAGDTVSSAVPPTAPPDAAVVVSPWSQEFEV
mmetsp:Transcript_46764/g.129966  ORF Transcript_46764/g.129966 Transcript_46764/m.129966 type:complete len:152 (+) Transcript_46764:318-773(+)